MHEQAYSPFYSTLFVFPARCADQKCVKLKNNIDYSRKIIIIEENTKKKKKIQHSQNCHLCENIIIYAQ